MDRHQEAYAESAVHGTYEERLSKELPKWRAVSDVRPEQISDSIVGCFADCIPARSDSTA